MKDKPLTIVFYVNSFLPTIGGKQFVVYYLAKSLQKLGHNVRVVSPGSWRKDKLNQFPFPVHKYAGLGTGRLKRKFEKVEWVIKVYEAVRLRALRINVSRFGGDIVHAHTTYPDGYIAVRLSEKTNIPVVITPHGEDIQIIPELEFGLRLKPQLKSRISHSLNSALALTAISKNVYSALLDANASKEKINMIPNGVDTERFSKDVDIDIRDWLAVPHTARLIVTIGQYHPRKGHDVLIRAMCSIVKQDPCARLVIIGKSDQSLERLVNELQLNEFVLLLGPIKSNFLIHADRFSIQHPDQKDLLAAILQDSECYVSAGIGEDSEGLSLAVLEAMAAAIPVIASDISGNRDVVLEGKNGLLVTPGNVEQLAQAVLKMLSDDAARKKMGSNAKSTASQYDWLEIAKQYESLYQRVHQEFCKVNSKMPD